MSKTDKSPRLVGILRFDAPSSSTRTLSATQAYDTFRSQIVLGSFTGKLTDKTATEKAEAGYMWSVGLTASEFGSPLGFDFDYEVAGAKRDDDGMNAGAGTVSLSATPADAPIIFTSSSSASTVIPGGVAFTGTTQRYLLETGSSSNSKATNANTTYYGAITVGLGEYKKWQGNYAVLKINTVTEKAILRIYAD